MKKYLILFVLFVATSLVANAQYLIYTAQQIVNSTVAEVYIPSQAEPISVFIRTAPADTSITNEGALSVGAGGANTATLTSNTSGSGTQTIAGGTNVTITETTGVNGTITIAATGDNLGNHTATTNVNMAGFNITNGGTAAFSSVTVTGRNLGGQGADVASASDLTLGDGNLFYVTGTTDITAISTAGWTNGSEITLRFQGVLNLINNTAGGGGTAVLRLENAGNIATTADDNITLKLTSAGWMQVAPIMRL